MRLLSLLFAFYFACLSTLTCADGEVVCKEATQTTVSAAAHTDCDAGALGDWCSPLCQCHCCGGAVVPLAPLPALTAAPAVTWATALRHARLRVGAPTRVTGAVWQPPQA